MRILLSLLVGVGVFYLTITLDTKRIINLHLPLHFILAVISMIVAMELADYFGL